ncbi:pyrophosphatase [Ralstonia sp. R-29]|uniref:pyrophosphatase n=1 Tax=Ralstonia sp. R-29 TaxID=3404059 RepID=UPI003CEAC804
MSNPSFAKRIADMNAMYKLPAQATPGLPADPADRLRKFKATLLDEINEIDDIVAACERNAEPIDVLVAVADLLGDVIVYCRSEALKYGIPLEEVLSVIMDSNESKLGADGKPIYDDNGKFLKGPNYWKPEPKIRELLQAALANAEA